MSDEKVESAESNKFTTMQRHLMKKQKHRTKFREKQRLKKCITCIDIVDQAISACFCSKIKSLRILKKKKKKESTKTKLQIWQISLAEMGHGE